MSSAHYDRAPRFYGLDRQAARGSDRRIGRRLRHTPWGFGLVVPVDIALKNPDFRFEEEFERRIVYGISFED